MASLSSQAGAWQRARIIATAVELLVTKYGFPRDDELGERVRQVEAHWGHRQPTAHDLALAVVVEILDDLPEANAGRFRRSILLWLFDATDMRDNGMLELQEPLAALQDMAWTKFGLDSEDGDAWPVGFDPFPAAPGGKRTPGVTLH